MTIERAEAVPTTRRPELHIVRDEEPTPEVVMGAFDIIDLRPKQFVKMSQVRRERNPATNDIKQSIMSDGELYYPLTVAKMDADALETYITFVNDVWGGDVSMEEFGEQEVAGHYFLIIDGHTRHQALSELEDEGLLQNFAIRAHVHAISSPEEIIQRQVMANFQKETPRERRAIAVVETYEWGKRTGKWQDEESFLTQNPNISQGVLANALNFARLPAHIREYVFKQKMSYQAGIELGRIAPTVWEHTLVSSGFAEKQPTVEELERLQTTYEMALTNFAKNITNKRMNSVQAEKHLGAQERGLQQDIETKLNGPDPTADDDALLAFGLFSEEDQLAMHAKEVQETYRRLLRENTSRPSTTALGLLELDQDFVPENAYRELVSDAEASMRTARELLGARAAKKAAIVATPSDLQE